MRSIGINKTYITILEDTYTGANARVHVDNQVSEEIPILRGMRQGDQISPKLFTATIQEMFKNAQIEEKGINIDGEKLSNLRFADGVAHSPNRRCERYGTSVNHCERRKLKDWSQDT